jgi:hypothetical protein
MAYRTIVLKDNGLSMPKEKAAGGAITPGMLIRRNAADQFIAYDEDNGPAMPMFARENELAPGTGSPTLDTPYASGDRTFANVYHSGHEVLALLAAGAAAIVIGDKIGAAADGTVKKWASGTVVGFALEAVDNSGGGTTARLPIEIA